MAVLSEHRTTLTIDAAEPITLDVSEQSLTMDLEWVPFIQAQLTVPLGDGAIAALDPTVDEYWATLTASRLLGRIDRLGDLTRNYRGRTLADLTAQFAGAQLADVSATLYHDYETPGHPKRAQVRECRLMLRSNDVDWKDATAALELASAEARLFDDARVGDEMTVPGATWRAVVEWMLTRSGLTLGSFPYGNTATGGVYADLAKWQPGQTAWDFVYRIARGIGGGLDIWADENGVIQIDVDRDTGTTRQLRSYGAERSVVNAQQKRSRDADWYTAVMLVWTAGGVTTRGYASTPGQPIRLYTRTHAAHSYPPADPNALAAHVLKTIRGRGAALELTAVSDYALTPGDTGRYDNPRAVLTGRIAAVQWAWPADEMNVRMREVS